MLLRKFCLGNNFSMNIKENTDFLLQRPRQLASAEMIFKDRRNVFCNVNLSNLGNLLQRNVRTGRSIWRQILQVFSLCTNHGCTFVSSLSLYLPVCPKKSGCVIVCIQYISLWPPFYKKNLYDHYY